MVARRTLACLVACACTHPAPPAQAPGGSEVLAESAPAPAPPPEYDDAVPPPYGQDELQRALAAERAAIAHQADGVAARQADPAPDDGLPGALADLAVHRRFVASLEACAESGRRCPPRLDDPAWSYDPDGLADPKLDHPLRYDLADWRALADELHGRACACRTRACVESLFVAIDVLGQRPMPDVAADDAAVTAITRARECLYRLHGE